MQKIGLLCFIGVFSTSFLLSAGKSPKIIRKADDVQNMVKQVLRLSGEGLSAEEIAQEIDGTNYLSDEEDMCFQEYTDDSRHDRVKKEIR